MAQPLPSFVELLASLDLESDENPEMQHYARYTTSPSLISSSPSWPSSAPSSRASPGRSLTSPGATSSLITPSPAIVISHPSPVEDSVQPRRRNSNRYNPYVTTSQNVFARRRSLPGDLGNRHNMQKQHDLTRASSASPPMRKGSLVASAHEQQGIRLNATELTVLKTDQPISTLVRRRLPRSFPQSPSVSKTPRHSVSPTKTFTPMSLPSLPPLPPISIGKRPPSYGYPDPDSTRLPPISALNRRSPTPETDGPEPVSREASRTPRSSSRGPRGYSSIDLGQSSNSICDHAAHKHRFSSP